MHRLGFGLLMILCLTTPAHAQLVAAVLPFARAGQVGQTTTVFATIINTGSDTALGCNIALPPGPFGPWSADFLYQTTDATNRLTGTPNTPVDISPGAAQSFLLAITPTAPITNDPRFFVIDSNVDLAFTFTCTNRIPAPTIQRVNTLRFFANTRRPVDIVALAATPTNDGVVNIPAGGFGVFSVAVTNAGVSSTTRINIMTGYPTCETNPVTGACLAPPVDTKFGHPPTFLRDFLAGETATFAVFVPDEGIAFDPARHRVEMLFLDSTITVGATHVAIRPAP